MSADVVDLSAYLHPNPLAVVISGPSAAGKDATICRMKELGHRCHFVVTATTRPQRPGEIHGVDYFFVSHSEFAGMLERGELIEHALVYGEHYGIPREQVRQALASGRDVVMRVDVQGAARLREVLPGAVSIFLTAASEQEQIARLRARRTETDEALQRRVATARAEMREIRHFDYVVINCDGELDCAVSRILAIIQAEKSRVEQRVVRL